MGERIQVTGFVTYINEKKGQSSRGPWTAYSFKIADEAGNEDPRWYQYGFSAPPFKDDKQTDGSGSYLTFEAEVKDDKVAKFIEGTGKIVNNPPARQMPEKKASGGGGGGRRGGGGGPKVKQSDLFGEIGGYNTEDDVRRISMSHAEEMAIRTVDMLLRHDGLPLTKTKSKANEAVRYEEITNAIDKFTILYFNNVRTGRLLDTVADAGEEVVKVAPLPADANDEPAATEPVAEPEQSEGPPPDPDAGTEAAPPQEETTF